MKLWHMTVEEALVGRWKLGKKEYRSDPDQPFQGDPVAELYEEMLDAKNYADEEIEHGVLGFRPYFIGLSQMLNQELTELRYILRKREGLE